MLSSRASIGLVKQLTVIHVLLCLLCLLPIGCRSNKQQGTRTFQVQGRVVSIGEDKRSIGIEHEDIPGFMPAMTMSFPIKDPNLIEGLSPNDLVRFELVVTPYESWISRIEKTGRAENTQNSQKSRENEPAILRPGEAIPPFNLIDQNGRRVSHADFRNKALAITFIFTRCPLPDYCPRFTSHFVDVQKQLLPKYNGRFHLISVTIDPQYDTPKVLKQYAALYNADLSSWSWLTGPDESIREMAARYGVRYWNEEGTISHTAACAVITPSGRLYKLRTGNTWTAEDVIGDLTAVLEKPQEIATGEK
ncbi:MAG: SCO family protein [Blastocatellia bacterium]|nr:SCO family protein [Blastocatellia bacterium]